MNNIQSLSTIKAKINQMAELALSMLKNTFDGFMKHDLEILASVLKDEQRLNDLESEIDFSLAGLSEEKVNSLDRGNIMYLASIAADLEEIGDYVKDMIERIEIKIQEKLLFSEDALDEYKHLYSIAEASLLDIVNALKMDDKNFAKRALCDGEHVESLLEKYRNAHTQRLISGVCDPRAGNMFLNLLDFAVQIFYHAKSIAKNILALE
jgi:phosphate:Na+ symporter